MLPGIEPAAANPVNGTLYSMVTMPWRGDMSLYKYTRNIKDISIYSTHLANILYSQARFDQIHTYLTSEIGA